MKTVVIIPAGGAGRRMGGDIPKQYLSLAGVPILVHTLRKFQQSPFVDEIFLVVPEGDVAEVRRDMVERYDLSRVSLVISGGRERQDSVRNALAHVRGGHEIILVHDGVRPFVTGGLIERAIAGAKAFGAVAPGVSVRDTVKKVDAAGWVVKTVQREGLWLVQTPQAFRRGVILAAYERAAKDGYYSTDDASLVEKTGIPVRMIPGDAGNIKITAPEDLERAERIVSGRKA
ncbi:MAG: 2-C-methyl-D-erythritol 4-phosphate cytidylyltransferase [Deltaproteobacteria bacterium]|nr:2-C-methyl-D-erythritol 4-phosphate cytidylyltransferase [Deltaproteobacteria bacterium]